jgi:hypothetical protein
VTLLALVNPRLGKFDVTDKGTSIAEARFDRATSRGPLLFAAASVVALTLAFPLRLAFFDQRTAGLAELHAILINALWALANLVTLVAAVCVAYEQPQQRRSPRVARDFRCELRHGAERRHALCLDISESGVRLKLAAGGRLPDGCRLRISAGPGAVALDARLVWCEWGETGGIEAGLAFDDVGAETHRALVELIFSDDRSWMRSTYPRDDPFRSFGYLLTTLWRVTRPRRSWRRRAPRAAGRWACAVNGRPGVCVALSTRGGLIELGDRVVGATSQRLELDPGSGRDALVLRGRAARSEGGRVALEWEEAQDAELAVLGELIAERAAAAGRVAAWRGLWKRLQAVRAVRAAR